MAPCRNPRDDIAGFRFPRSGRVMLQNARFDMCEPPYLPLKSSPERRLPFTPESYLDI